MYIYKVQIFRVALDPIDLKKNYYIYLLVIYSFDFITLLFVYIVLGFEFLAFVINFIVLTFDLI